MTTQDWLQKAQEHKDTLIGLIIGYHPINQLPKLGQPIPANITAPGAEQACEVVREQIRQETVFTNPEGQFSVALANQDFETVYGLLSDTWFGVPESTDCWHIPGFSVLVDLLDDLPEQEYDNNNN